MIKSYSNEIELKSDLDKICFRYGVGYSTNDVCLCAFFHKINGSQLTPIQSFTSPVAAVAALDQVSKDINLHITQIECYMFGIFHIGDLPEDYSFDSPSILNFKKCYFTHFVCKLEPWIYWKKPDDTPPKGEKND